MFQAKNEIRDAVQRLLDTTAPYGRGDVIPWGVIEHAAGNRLSHPGCYIIKAWRKRLRKDRGIVCRTVRGVGVELLTKPDQVTRPGEDRRRRASRQLTTAIREIAAVDGEELPDHLRRVRTMQLDSLRNERRSVRRGARQVKRKSETLPVRQVAV